MQVGTGLLECDTRFEARYGAVRPPASVRVLVGGNRERGPELEIPSWDTESPAS